MPRHYHRGLSLIELIFVIIIIALGALGTIQLIQQHNANQKLDKTSKTAQDILTAAQSYYIREQKKWPSSLQALIDAGYVNTSIECTPWVVQNPSNPTKCGNHSSYGIRLDSSNDLTLSKYVLLTIDTGSSKIANLVAAQTPTSIINNSQVQAIIPVPGPPNIAGSLIIKNIEYVQSYADSSSNGQRQDSACWEESNFQGTSNITSIPDSACPPGYVGANYTAGFNYLYNDNRFTQALGGKGIGYINLIGLYTPTYNTTGDKGFGDANNWPALDSTGWMQKASSWNLGMMITSTVIGRGLRNECGHHLALVISYCIPKNYDPYDD